METVPDGVVYLCGELKVWFDRSVSGLWRINRGPDTLTYPDGKTPRRFRTAAHAKQYAELHLADDLEAPAPTEEVSILTGVPEVDPPQGYPSPAPTTALVIDLGEALKKSLEPKEPKPAKGKRGAKPRVVMPNPDDAGDEGEEDGDAEGEA
jgi:hypothetical protein